MAEFEIAFNRTIRFEDSTLSGVITDEPGGAIARLGVNSHAHPEVYPEMKTCDRDRALDIAKHVLYSYWLFGGVTDQDVANKLFDMAVNMGNGQAVKLLQRAVGEVADGKFGPLTLRATNEYGDWLVVALRTVSADFYHQLAAQDPTKYAASLSGWLVRASR